MGNLFKWDILFHIRSFPYKWISISGVVGIWGPRFLKFIFTIQSNLYTWGIKEYFHLKMGNFAEISVMKHNLYYNPWEMKIYFFGFLNYISYCVYLLSKAIQQTVFVVCTVKWQKMFK